MKGNLYFCFILIINLSVELSAQKLSSQLVDRESSEPIAYASVFLSNTSIGTLSDENGFFQLDLAGLAEAELVVSHLAYELYSMNLKKASDLGPVIYLNQIEKKLEDVVIEEKYGANRKKLLRKFRKAFLGQSSNSNKSAILNPESIIIFKKNDSIFAESLGPIKVSNPALGYEVQFYLEDFQLSKDQSLSYKGKVLFEELAPETEISKKVSRQRIKSYLLSSRNFYPALFRDSLEESKYEIGYVPNLKEDGSFTFTAIEPTDLDIRKGIKSDTLFLDGYLAIVNKRLTSFWDRFKQKNKYPSSIIRSLSGYFLVSKNGILLNPEDIEEYGYWTRQRVAELLPLDYSLDPKFLDPSYQLIDSLNAYTEKRAREKIFLHLNKYNYFSGEDIWFRAYLMDAKNHGKESPSQVYHVELINPEGQIIDSLSFHSTKANWGKFRLKPGLASGQYLLRAYTNYMRNRPQTYFFQEYIDIWGKSEEQESQAMLSTHLEERTNKASIPKLHFYPEGGKLIEGQENIMAIRLVDPSPQPSPGEVVIEDENKMLVGSVSLDTGGIGSISLSPKQGKEYKAYIKDRGKKNYVEIPPIDSSGFRLRVINNDKDFFRIKISHTEAKALNGAFLLAHVRGALSLFIDEIEAGQIINIPKNTLITGLVEFSLFDPKGNLEARRLAFNESGLAKEVLKINSMGQSLSGDRIKLELSLLDSLKTPGETQLSLSVTDPIFDLRKGSSIAPYVLLESDLGLMPGSMAQFFPLNKDKRKALDLFLMAWDGPLYDWKEILSAKEEPNFQAEQGIRVQGYTSDGANPKKKIEASVMINTLSESFFIEESRSDSSGYFEFEAPLFLDSTIFVVQARKGVQKANDQKLELDGRRDVEIEFVAEEKPEINFPAPIYIQEENSRWEAYAQDNALAAQEALDLILDTVAIEARRGADLRLYDLYNLNELDFVQQDTRGINLISALKPASRYEYDYRDQKLYYLTYFQGLPQRYEVTFVINGLVSSYLTYQGLSADLIDYIGIYGTTIVVQSRRNGPRSMEKLLEQGIKSFFHPGFHEGEHKFSVVADATQNIKPAPVRSHAIHWEAEVKFDAEGKAVLEVLLPEESRNIFVKAEGLTPEGKPISASKSIDLKEEE